MKVFGKQRPQEAKRARISGGKDDTFLVSKNSDTIVVKCYSQLAKNEVQFSPGDRSYGSLVLTVEEAQRLSIQLLMAISDIDPTAFRNIDGHIDSNAWGIDPSHD